MNEKIPNLEEVLSNPEDFNDYLDRKRKELEIEEKKIRSRELPIPDFLYHVTTRENAQQIRNEGIDPSKLYFEDKEAVSLSDDPEFAFRVAEKTQQINKRNLVLLKIDTQYLTPSRIESYLRTEDPNKEDLLKASAVHEVHYTATIPPEAIKIVKA